MRTGSSSKICGPGVMPNTIIAARMTAAAPDPGTPRVRSGTMAPPSVALLAASGAARPSCDPWPNSSLFLEKRFASL